MTQSLAEADGKAVFSKNKETYLLVGLEEYQGTLKETYLLVGLEEDQGTLK